MSRKAQLWDWLFSLREIIAWDLPSIAFFKTASYDDYRLNNQKINYLNLIDGSEQTSCVFSNRYVFIFK